MNLKIAGFIPESIVDGPGIRFTVFTQGCRHQCKGCHNPHTHDFTKGYLINIDTLVDKIITHSYLDGLTISGGEPFMQAKAINELLSKIRPMNTIIYTGYTFEELISLSKENSIIIDVLQKIDFLIDGRFILEEKDLSLKYRGSKNQRIIKVKESLHRQKIITLNI